MSNKWGPYFFVPIYWNMAPNYDMTITPGLLTKRGVQLSDNFRYLTETETGHLNISVLPNDKLFGAFQKKGEENVQSLNPAIQPESITEAELNRLLNSSTTRKGLLWRNDSQFTDHWSSHIDYNYASDDYYLRDFGSSLNEITLNQLLQEGDLYYKSQYWNFTGRVQAYQTLHPIDEPPVQNIYRRFPQLILNGDYPDQIFGLNYFINNELTHFEILKTPGTNTNLPTGNRINVQTGINLPIDLPYFYLNPRLQLAMTQYQLFQVEDTDAPNSKRRVLPIFDVASGLAFDRDTTLFNHDFVQTLEPEIYYTYIPYRNQSSIPVFDTTVNTLTYDQIFNYNRFSGIDRIGDANQIGIGISTRLIDQASGFEKVRVGVGDIIYFANRRVTLCNNKSQCTDYPDNPNNHYRLSPVSGLLKYGINPQWDFTMVAIWNPITKQMDNSTVGLHYEPDNDHIFNLSYSFAHTSDPSSGLNVNGAQNNLKLTDFSFVWPLVHEVSAVGRWSQDWNTNHFQNLLYGLQYDTCCWAVRLVGGRAFTHLQNNNIPQYNNEVYLQFALKGLGNVGSDPSGLLRNITGYNTQFGQEI